MGLFLDLQCMTRLGLTLPMLMIAVGLYGCRGKSATPDRLIFTRSGQAAIGSYGWTLIIERSGREIIELHSFDYGPVAVSMGTKTDALFAAFEGADAFSLPREVGRPVPDGARRSLIVEARGRRHEMVIYMIDPLSYTERDATVLRLWRLVRDLFDEGVLDENDRISPSALLEAGIRVPGARVE